MAFQVFNYGNNDQICLDVASIKLVMSKIIDDDVIIVTDDDEIALTCKDEAQVKSLFEEIVSCLPLVCCDLEEAAWFCNRLKKEDQSLLPQPAPATRELHPSFIGRCIGMKAMKNDACPLGHHEYHILGPSNEGKMLCDIHPRCLMCKYFDDRNGKYAEAIKNMKEE